MFDPQIWWNGLSAFWKVVTSVLAGLAAIKAGWKPVADCVAWFVDRYDKPVFGVLEGRKRIEWLTANPSPIVMPPVFMTFVAKAVKRRPKSVFKSLQRLEKKGKVHQGPYGWSWGPRIVQSPPRST